MEVHGLRDPFALHRDNDYYYEIIKSGNAEGDDDNWGLHVNGNNLEVCVKVSGSWVVAFVIERPN